MEHHNRHYLLYVQLLLLAGMLLLSVGGQGLARLAAVLPFVVSAALLLITVRLCAAIIRMVDPQLASRRDNRMHGSALPVLVYAPQT